MTTLTTRRPETRGDCVAGIIAAATAWVKEQEMLTQGRCVDVLLDLYGATADEFVQWCIAERLRDIRFLHAVDGDEMRSDLAIIGALTFVGEQPGPVAP